MVAVDDTMKAATDAISHAISDLVSKLSHSRIGENRETKNTTSNDPPYRPHLDTILHTALFIPWRPKGFIHWSSSASSASLTATPRVRTV